MADEPRPYPDSVSNLFQSLRDLSDNIKAVEMRVRVLEEKRYQAEGDLKTQIATTTLQLAQLVTDAANTVQTNKETTASLAMKIDGITSAINGKFEKVNEKQDRIIRIITWVSGVATGIFIISELLLKFFK